MKKLVGSLSILFLFFMFSCGSGPETADEQEAHDEVEMLEREVEADDQEVRERSTRGETEVRERSIAGDKQQEAEKKPIERIRIDPEENKEQPELQLEKKEEPQLEIERP